MSLPILVLIAGLSMGPAFPGYHAVLSGNYADVRIGTIVVYENPFTHGLTSHRVTGGWAGHWIAKGDANASVDRGYITPENFKEIIDPYVIFRPPSG